MDVPPPQELDSPLRNPISIKILIFCIVVSLVYALIISFLYFYEIELPFRKENISSSSKATEIRVKENNTNSKPKDLICPEVECSSESPSVDRSAYFKFSPNRLFGMYIAKSINSNECEIIFTQGNGREFDHRNIDAPLTTSCDYYAGGYATGQYMWHDDLTFIYTDKNVKNTFYRVKLELGDVASLEEIVLQDFPEKYDIRRADSSLSRAIVYDGETASLLLIDLENYAVLLDLRSLGILGSVYYDDINNLFLVTQPERADLSEYKIIAIDSANNIDSEIFTQDAVEVFGRGCSGSWIHSGYKKTYIIDFCSSNETFEFNAFDDVLVIFGSDQYYYDKTTP